MSKSHNISIKDLIDAGTSEIILASQASADDGPNKKLKVLLWVNLYGELITQISVWGDGTLRYIGDNVATAVKEYNKV